MIWETVFFVIVTKTALLPTVFKIPYFMSHKIKVWNVTRVRKYDRFFFFFFVHVNYPFNICIIIIIILNEIIL